MSPKELFREFVSRLGEFEAAAKEVLGAEMKTGKMIGYLNCPEHKAIIDETQVPDGAWPEALTKIKYCGLCGSMLLLEKKELIYPGNWLNEMNELIHDAEYRKTVLAKLDAPSEEQVSLIPEETK